MTIKIACNVKNLKFGRKIRSEIHLLSSPDIKRSTTEKFPIKTHLEMIDSSVISYGEVEYDNQNCLQHQKTPVCPKSRSEFYLILTLYINRSVTKKFPIETRLEIIDSSVRSLGEVE